MPRFAFHGAAPYIEHLHSRELATSLDASVSAQTRALVASDERLEKVIQESNRQLQNAVEHGLREGFSQVSEQLSIIGSEVAHLTTVMEWGFSEVLASLGMVSAGIEELRRLASTPSQVWAYEQYEIAREAFRRGHYEDALDYLERAIEGHGSNTGYRIEFRFHLLRGQIHLGSFRNNDPAIVNLPKAASAFLSAAKYAESISSDDAARAWLAAGWAASCMHDLEDGLKYTLRSRELDALTGAADFQLGKIYAAMDEIEPSVACFRRALQVNRYYSVKVLGDGDYMKFENAISDVVRGRIQEEAAAARQAIERLESKIDSHADRGIAEYSVRSMFPAQVKHAEQRLRDAKRLLAEASLLSVMDARTAAKEGYDSILEAITSFRRTAATRAKEDRERLERERADLLQRAVNQRDNATTVGRVLGGFLGAIVGIFGCNATMDTIDGCNAVFAGVGAWIGLIGVGVIVGWIVAETYFVKKEPRIAKLSHSVERTRQAEEELRSIVSRM